MKEAFSNINIKDQESELSSEQLRFLLRQFKEHLEILRDETKIKAQTSTKDFKKEIQALERAVFYADIAMTEDKSEKELSDLANSLYELYESWSLLLNVEKVPSYKEMVDSSLESWPEEEVRLMMEKIENIEDSEYFEKELAIKKELKEEIAVANIEEKELIEDNLEFRIKEIRSEIESIETARDEFTKKRLAKLEKKLLKLAGQKDSREIEFLKNRLNSFLDSEEGFLFSNMEDFSGKEKETFFKILQGDLLSETFFKNLKNQGFAGRTLLEGITSLNSVIKFYLWGLSPSNKSIVVADKLGEREVDPGVNIHGLEKIGSLSWAEAHGWKEEFLDSELYDIDLDELLKYISHYEVNALSNGIDLNNSEYFQKVLKIISDKLELARKKEEETLMVFETYLTEEFEETNSNLKATLDLLKFSEEKKEIYGKMISAFAGSNFFLENGIPEAAMTALSLTEKFKKDEVDLGEDLTELVDEEVLEKRNISKDEFINSHPVLKTNLAIVAERAGKISLQFKIGENGHFQIKQEALRILVAEILSVKEILDKDGFSILDHARVEHVVTVLNKLLEGKEYDGYEFSDLEGSIQHMDNKIIVNDYKKFEKIIKELLKRAKAEVVKITDRPVLIAMQKKGALDWVKVIWEKTNQKKNNKI